MEAESQVTMQVRVGVGHSSPEVVWRVVGSDIHTHTHTRARTCRHSHCDTWGVTCCAPLPHTLAESLVREPVAQQRLSQGSGGRVRPGGFTNRVARGGCTRSHQTSWIFLQVPQTGGCRSWAVVPVVYLWQIQSLCCPHPLPCMLSTPPQGEDLGQGKKRSLLDGRSLTMTHPFLPLVRFCSGPDAPLL